MSEDRVFEEIGEGRVYEATIYLRSGQCFVIDVTKLVVKKNGLGAYTQVEWITPEDTETSAYRNLQMIRFEEVVAIVLK